MRDRGIHNWILIHWTWYALSSLMYDSVPGVIIQYSSCAPVQARTCYGIDNG